jgi:hypothetical protein
MLSTTERPSYIFENYPADWPAEEFYVNQGTVTHEQYDHLNGLIESGATETDLEAFFNENQAALALVLTLFRTGHHASWIVPKQIIRARLTDTSPGLIPYYLIAGANSDGVTWWVLEVKSPGARIFGGTDSAKTLSTEANRGIIQLLEYIDVCAENQAYLRDQAGLKGLREPKGLLLIGSQAELDDPRNRKLKQAWNNKNPALQIRTYSGLIREFDWMLKQIS